MPGGQAVATTNQALKSGFNGADPQLMSAPRRRCRVCGAVWPDRSHYWITDGGGCRTCEGSPLCDSCGHPRSHHVAVFRKGKRHCKFRAFDLQSLSRMDCDCPGYAVVDGQLADAGFAQVDCAPIPQLRLADGSQMSPGRLT